MQDKIIIIIKTDQGTLFKTSIHRSCYINFHVKKNLCCICRDYLDDGYCYIINELRKNNLLPVDFKMMCCECYSTYNR